MSEESDELDRLIARRRQRLEDGTDADERPLLKLLAAKQAQKKTDCAIATITGQMIEKKRIDEIVKVFAGVVARHWPVTPDDRLEGLIAAKSRLEMSSDLDKRLCELFGCEPDAAEVAATENLRNHLQSQIDAKRSQLERERTGARYESH